MYNRSLSHMFETEASGFIMLAIASFSQDQVYILLLCIDLFSACYLYMGIEPKAVALAAGSTIPLGGSFQSCRGSIWGIHRSAR